MLPENLPAVATAPLPGTYDAARQALATCVDIDECKTWADKAQALASYARQADDDSLLKLATRIQARAVRRAGELLQEFDARGEHRKSAGGDTSSQRQAAEEAGMSKRQQVTAVRVANVPAETFDAAVEGDNPPTVTALAEMGKQARPQPVPPQGFRQATHLLGALRDFAKFCGEHAPELVAGGVLAEEVAEVRQQIAAIDHWLDGFVAGVVSETGEAFEEPPAPKLTKAGGAPSDGLDDIWADRDYTHWFEDRIVAGHMAPSTISSLANNLQYLVKQYWGRSGRPYARNPKYYGVGQFGMRIRTRPPAKAK